jgi:hypothetical protein
LAKQGGEVSAISSSSSPSFGYLFLFKRILSVSLDLRFLHKTTLLPLSDYSSELMFPMRKVLLLLIKEGVA